MVGTILAIIFFFIVVAACCASDSGSSSKSTSPKRNAQVQRRSAPVQRSSRNYSYSECPSCGAPYYDGYCEECGYPDINQGWLGEEYG